MEIHSDIFQVLETALRNNFFVEKVSLGNKISKCIACSTWTQKVDSTPLHLGILHGFESHSEQFENDKKRKNKKQLSS